MCKQHVVLLGKQNQEQVKQNLTNNQWHYYCIIISRNSRQQLGRDHNSLANRHNMPKEIHEETKTMNEHHVQLQADAKRFNCSNQ